jgi:hypothetical protein
MENPNKIPKIIHQTWKNENVPDYLKDFQKSWLKFNPEYEYQFWTDIDIENFIRSKYKWFYHIFKSYDSNIKRVDAFRYFLLYEYGGIYVDLDFECLRSFDNLMENNTCFFGSEPPQHFKKWKVTNLLPCNALMASIPKHPFWKFVCNELPKYLHIINIVKSTGPVFLRSCYFKWIKQINYSKKPNLQVKCYSHKYFYPSADIVCLYRKNKEKFENEHLKRLNNIFYDETHAIHHWSSTYSSHKNKKKNYLKKLTNMKKKNKYPQVLFNLNCFKAKNNENVIQNEDIILNENIIQNEDNENIIQNEDNENVIQNEDNENVIQNEDIILNENIIQNEIIEPKKLKGIIKNNKRMEPKLQADESSFVKKNVIITDTKMFYPPPNMTNINDKKNIIEETKTKIQLKYPMKMFNNEKKEKSNNVNNVNNVNNNEIINVIISNNKKTIKILSNKLRYKR